MRQQRATWCGSRAGPNGAISVALFAELIDLDPAAQTVGWRRRMTSSPASYGRLPAAVAPFGDIGRCGAVVVRNRPAPGVQLACRRRHHRRLHFIDRLIGRGWARSMPRIAATRCSTSRWR